MKKLNVLIVLLSLFLSQTLLSKESYTIKSPDGKLSLTFRLSATGEPVYSIAHSGVSVLKPSRLGVVRSDGDFSKKLRLDSVSTETTVRDTYTLVHGKRLTNVYKGTRRAFYLQNSETRRIGIIFQVSNEGVAFRYHFPERSSAPVTIYNEATTYHFDISARGFLQPCADARVGWCFASPSYEEYYQLGISVGTPSPNQAGWVMPALFNSGYFWVSVTETAIDTNYCATRLSQLSPDGEYGVQFPQPQESKSGGPVVPQSRLPWLTPWRVIAVSKTIGGLVESTLETDLAAPAKYDVSAWCEPGISSWSWVMLKDDSTVYSAQKTYIDFAASMHWKYCLIDALWDTQIGYEKLKDLAAYGKMKNVKVLVWYNSAGDWNSVTMTPKDKLLTPQTRESEFKRLEEMGIAGVKIDFFGGDGQSMMKYYQDILTDAQRHKLAVNFHGATYPRSWHRTYPNLVSMEAIRGEEYVTFGQFFADQQPVHCAAIPFTRNLFDPMDFTPVNLSGIPNIKRRTSRGFELALSVLFTSGIQHIAETPWGMEAQEEYVKAYMRSLPVKWDDVKFIDGYPGKYVVLARRSGTTWYVAGINAEQTPRTVTLPLPAISGAATGILITDEETGSGVEKQEIGWSVPHMITMKPNGGFVLATH